MRDKLYIAIAVATIIAAGALVPTSRALAQDDPGGAPTEAAPAPVTISAPSPGTWVQVIGGAPGMDEYRWWDEDFCWDHIGFDPDGKIILSAQLELYAWDVDSDAPEDPEVDVISAGGQDIGSLVGSGETWSTTTLPIPPAVAQAELQDGVLPVCVDIDSTHDSMFWAVTIDWSRLTIRYAPVYVDIKPTSCPNPLNVNAKGVLPVAILGTEYLDVCSIEADSIMLGGVAPLRFSYEDVATPFDGELCGCTTEGPDGYLDLVAKFSIPEVAGALGTVEDGEEIPLIVEALRSDGMPFTGSDCVRIIDKKSE